MKKTGANATVIYVPPIFAADAMMEAADAGIPFIVCITEGVPVLDMTRVYPFVKEKGSRLLGPNCPGLISPGKSKVGIIPGRICTPGNVGLVSRSGTLTYEVVFQMTRAKIGQTTCVGIGGDPINGTNFIDCLDAFEKDPETEAVVMIGEIGGTDEQEAAKFVREKMKKPVVGFIAGQTAPPGRRMGHAGAIISGSAGTAAEKMQAFEENGVGVAKRPIDVVDLLKRANALGQRQINGWQQNTHHHQARRFRLRKGGQIIAHLEKAGFKVVAARVMQLTEAQARRILRGPLASALFSRRSCAS